MAKSPEDYFAELAKVKPSPTGIKPLVQPSRKKGGFPTGLLLLLIGGTILYGFVHYFSYQDPQDAVKAIANALPPKFRQAVTRELVAHHLLQINSFGITTAASEGTTGTPSAAHATGTTSAPRAPASQSAADFDYVNIDGRWYKKSPNNIYMINGHPVFYVDHHHVAPPANKVKK